jgi:hypothetical protein
VGGDNAESVCSVDSDCTGGSCQKLKKQSKLIGWQGYCIEPDLSRPINAEQGNFACLTWFPKDNITGALDINNQHVEAGFQATEASGKYYCLNARGNQSVTNVVGVDVISYDKFLGQQSVVTAPGHGINSREKRIITLDVSSPVYRDEIDYLTISATGNSDWFPNGTNKFFIRNGYITKYNSQLQVVKREGSEEAIINNPQTFAGESGGLNVGRYVWSDGRDKNFWYMRYDDGEGDGNNQYQYADPNNTGMQGEQFKDLLSNCAGSIDVAGNDNYQDICLGGDIDDNDDGCAVRAVFNADGRLDRINLTCFSGDAGDSESASFTVTAGLRETCTNIAQTTNDSSYTSVGWTDRLWKRSNFIIDSAGLNYKNSLNSAPFGSLSMQGLLVPEDLVSVFSHMENQQPQPANSV